MRQKIKDKSKEGWNVTVIFSDIAKIRQSMPLYFCIYFIYLFIENYQYTDQLMFISTVLLLGAQYLEKGILVFRWWLELRKINPFFFLPIPNIISIFTSFSMNLFELSQKVFVISLLDSIPNFSVSNSASIRSLS